MARVKQNRRSRDASSSSIATLEPAESSSRATLGRSICLGGAALLGALVLGFLVYGPALRGPFVFDDFALPFRHPDFRGESLRDWMASVRPLLMLSYWFDYQLSGRESTVSYHVVTLLIHCLNTLLVGAVIWRFLTWNNERSTRTAVLAVAGAGIFLLHPLQSESVAYIAGRSESLSALWCLAAWSLSLYRPDPVLSWPRALAILAFFCAAVATKEHTVALAGVLLLTDTFLSGAPLAVTVRRNWRLYLPLAAGAVAGTLAAWRVLANSSSAGFAMKGIQWYEYALTQARVLLTYVRLVLFPVGLTVDHDVALSTSLMDHGAGLAVLFWIVAAVAAIAFRRKYPIACYGLLIFLVLLAPTSSFIPIKDVMAERRMYLPLVGLLLIALDGLSRVSITSERLATLAACTLTVLAFCTYERSKAWGDSERLWESAIAATPAKARPYGNLASVYLIQRQCYPALSVFERAERAGVAIRDATALATWALALECSGDLPAGLNKMKEAIGIESSAQAFAALGRMYLRARDFVNAEQAFAEAERLNPALEMTFVYRAMLHFARNDEPKAIAELNRALSLNPSNREALRLLEQTVVRSRSIP
jgi:hypothetical protein